MDASAFRVRGEACDRLTKAVAVLTIHKNENGGYAYDEALIFEKQVVRELERKHHEGTIIGMKGLLSVTSNTFNNARSMKVYTRASILKASRSAAEKAIAASKAIASSAPDVEPEIKSN